MTSTRRKTLGGLALSALTVLLALAGAAGPAAAQRGGESGYTAGCGGIPIVGGTPPWGFHTGAPSPANRQLTPVATATSTSPPTPSQGSCARRPGRGGTGPADRDDGSLTSSPTLTSRRCGGSRQHHEDHRPRDGQHRRGLQVGTIGAGALFASYNSVRSDSVQFFFPAACRDHDHLYHGTQVNNQVPPL